MIKTQTQAHDGVRHIKVWDPLVRLIHWSIAFTILLNGAVLDDDGDAHKWVGYAAFGLVCTRLLWGFVGSQAARFSTFPLSPTAALGHMRAIVHGERKVHLSHNPLGALMVYNIWGTVLIICITGFMMGTIQFYGVEWVEEAHEIAFGWLVFSVALHVGGVFFETWHSGVPLFKAMLNGRKSVPQGRAIE